MQMEKGAMEGEGRVGAAGRRWWQRSGRGEGRGPKGSRQKGGTEWGEAEPPRARPQEER